MIQYVPILHLKKYEKALAPFFSKEMQRSHALKPYLRLMKENDFQNLLTTIAPFTPANEKPFVGWPRKTSVNSGDYGNLDHLHSVNLSESKYLSAELGLCKMGDHIIPTYDASAQHQDSIDQFVDYCHEKEVECAIFADSFGLNYSKLKPCDWLLVNIGQSIVYLQSRIDQLRRQTTAKIVLIIENRLEGITHSSLSTIEPANKGKIKGDLLALSAKEGRQFDGISGFGDFAGWKNTINISGGWGRSATKTAYFYERSEFQFTVIKDDPQGTIKQSIADYSTQKDPNDERHLREILAQYIKTGNQGQFNALSQLYYIAVLLSDYEK